MDASESGNLAPDLRAGLSERLRGGWLRLRRTPPAELAHRALRGLQARAERGAWFGRDEVPQPQLDTAAAGSQFAPWLHPRERADAPACVAAAERIAEGWLDVLALRDVDLGTPPRWNRDPKTGIEAPLEFGKLLDCRDRDRVGDIRYLWEPNRHRHLVTLARAWSLTGHKAYYETARDHLESWLLACPYRYGPNWASAAEVARRLTNWTAAWQLFGGAQSRLWSDAAAREFRARWLRSAYQHAEFVRGWLSLHSAANHQLITQAAALFLAGLAFPYWTRAHRWLAAGKALLEREALAQVAPDGVDREQALGAQRRKLDTLLLCLLAGRANRQAFSPAYEARVEAMLDFLASLADAGGNLPLLGDSDADDADPAACRSLLALGAVLFGRGDFKHKAGELDDRARWLLGAGAAARYAALDGSNSDLPPRQAFPEGGYFVLGCELGGAGELRAVVDAGPLGYRAAAHAHADALSFTLSAGGRALLVDPGACSAYAHPVWRDYFRGTAAHNTVRVDGADQSQADRASAWLHKARSACSLWLSTASKDSFEGWHDGYMRLPDPVKHRRL
ncbi:MAG TPA: alginate lyase family protein, partial [Burkholderiales bacterium]